MHFQPNIKWCDAYKISIVIAALFAAFTFSLKYTYDQFGIFFSLFIFFFRFVFSIPLVIKAYDIDAGLNSHLHYDIVETMPRRYFHIDSTTGAIKTVMLLDHEKIPQFTFHVKVNIFHIFFFSSIHPAAHLFPSLLLLLSFLPHKYFVTHFILIP